MLFAKNIGDLLHSRALLIAFAVDNAPCYNFAIKILMPNFAPFLE